MNILLVGYWGPDEAGERAAWADALHSALAQHLPGARLLQQRDAVAADSIRAAIVANPPPGSLQGLPALGLIQSLWAGVDRLLADPTLPAGVPIARMVDPAMNQAMAETALWAVLGLHRHFPRYAAQQRAGQWQALPQRRADEVPVLLLGLGQMGGATARLLASAGYPVTAWRRAGATPDAAGAAAAAEGADTPALPPGVRVVRGGDVQHGALAQALAGAQVLVNLLPLTPATRGLIDARLLATLPAGAGVVNLARGAHLVEADLLAALDAGHIAHAVLDVFNQEPLPAAHRFWQHPRVTVLPHAAAQTDARSAAAIAARNLAAFARGEPVANAVLPQRGY